MSVKYAHTALSMANLWGYIISHKMARPFLPVKSSRGYDRLKLINANTEKNHGVSIASRQITPELLESTKSKMNQVDYSDNGDRLSCRYIQPQF